MNIGILVSHSGLSDFRVKTLQPILEDNNFNIKVAIVDTRRGKTFKEKIIKNFKRGRGGYMIVMAFQRLFSKSIEDSSVDTYEYCQANNIETIETNDPYSKETLDAIKAYNLDTLLLVGGYGIVKEPLIALTPNGILSYHHGDMRKYRGMPPVFWELYNNEKEVGMTLQKLSVGLDCGTPIVEKSVKIDKKDSLKSLEKKVNEESIEMMYEALCKLLDSNYQPETIDKFGKVYTLPNLREWISFNIRMFFRKYR